MKNVQKLELMEFNNNELVGNEIDVIKELNEYTGNVGDAISAISDSNTPIYYNELWKNAQSISDYIEEGLLHGLEHNNDINSILSTGYYLYYNELLNNNITEFAFNRVVSQINSYIEENELSLNIDELDDYVSNSLSDFYDGSTLDTLEDIVNEVLELIENGEFNI